MMLRTMLLAGLLGLFTCMAGCSSDPALPPPTTNGGDDGSGGDAAPPTDEGAGGTVEDGSGH